MTVTDAYVPATQSNATGANNPNLTAFMVGTSDPGDYGTLSVYEAPQGTAGPANADASIGQNPTVSKDITLLDQHGSEVLLGNTLMVPIGQSIVYLRPLYVASSSSPQPQLNYVIGVLGQKVVIESTVSTVLSQLLHTQIVPAGEWQRERERERHDRARCPPQCSNTSMTAQTDYQNALTALASGDLGDLPDQHQRDAAEHRQGPGGSRNVRRQLDTDHDHDNDRSAQEQEHQDQRQNADQHRARHVHDSQLVGHGVAIWMRQPEHACDAGVTPAWKG